MCYIINSNIWPWNKIYFITKYNDANSHSFATIHDNLYLTYLCKQNKIVSIIPKSTLNIKIVVHQGIFRYTVTRPLLFTMLPGLKKLSENRKKKLNHFYCHKCVHLSRGDI